MNAKTGYTMDEICVAFIMPDKIFYMCVLSQLARFPTKHIPTMGVGYSKAGKLCLLYNEDFVKTLSLPAAIAVLEHELLHIVWRHLNRFKITESNKQFAEIMNVAEDIAINQYLPEMYSCPELANCCTPEKFDLPKEMLADWYIEELKKKSKDKPNMKMGQGQNSGSHDNWNDQVDPDTGEKQDAQAQGIDTDFQEGQLVERAFKQAKEKGCIPSFLKKEVEAFLAEEKHDWRKTLKVFVASVLTVNKRMSSKRVNRRFMDQDFILPGKKKTRKPNVLVVRDTSGSVFNEDTQDLFLNEMLIISKRCGTMWIADCDTEVHQHYRVKNKNDFREYEGGGGTSFVPAFDLAKKLGVDGIIYLTDTYGDFPNKEDIGKFGMHTVWVTFNMPEVDLPFGKHVNIEP